MENYTSRLAALSDRIRELEDALRHQRIADGGHWRRAVGRWRRVTGSRQSSTHHTLSISKQVTNELIQGDPADAGTKAQEFAGIRLISVPRSSNLLLVQALQLAFETGLAMAPSPVRIQPRAIGGPEPESSLVNPSVVS